MATTPLLSIQEPQTSNSSFVLISSSGKNPDAAAAMAAAAARGAEPLVLITRRQESDLPDRVLRHSPQVVTVPSPPDGFLATNSVAAMTAALIVANGHELATATQLEDLPAPPSDVRGRMLVLHGWGLQNVAYDIETRLSELGLAAVQVADYRNFAHGRHVGFDRNFMDTTVVALIDPTSWEIGERTLAQIPDDAQVIRMESALDWPSSALHLLRHSSRLPMLLDARDPAKPKVPAFGRKLYNLPIARILKTSPHGPVDTKSVASGQGLGVVQAAYETWERIAIQCDVGAVVLDYDGTCCTTAGRFDPPSDSIQAELVRLLEMGLRLGFASGRGKSLPLALREWIPERYWSDITVGLYNGSSIQHLSDDIADHSHVPPLLKGLENELRAEFDAEVRIDARSTQLSVESIQGVRGDELLPIVRTVIGRNPGLFKAFASGHSVDVVSCEHSKRAVLEAMRLDPDKTMVAIGDRGSLDGNDFELLAATPLSLSVGTVSPDLTRCWNLDDRGEAGPPLLRRYLQAIGTSRKRVAFDWKPSA